MPKDNQKNTLLLVTRSTSTARLVGKHLHDYFKVMTAEDAESAWDTLLEFSEISLVICELELVIDQFGLLERIRSASDSWLAATPVLLMVGEADSDSSRELAFQMGATDFINMPFSSSELDVRARLHANLYLQHQAGSGQEFQQPVAAVDVLQQLSQQNFFDSRARQELSFSQRHRSHLSLCKLRVDNIRAIIDEFDKAAAYSTLKAVAKFMQQTLRREDTLCYLGSAEFHVLYPATNGIGATAALNRIIDRLSRASISAGGNQISVSLSGAVYSCIASDGIELEAIYRKLDEGVERAQEEGSNRVVSTSAGADQREYSLDRALQLIAAGRGADLAAHARPLMQNLLPLLEFADDVLELGLEPVSRDLRRQLESDAE